jgi:hypothetical protein
MSRLPIPRWRYLGIQLSCRCFRMDRRALARNGAFDENTVTAKSDAFGFEHVDHTAKCAAVGIRHSVARPFPYRDGRARDVRTLGNFRLREPN